MIRSLSRMLRFGLAFGLMLPTVAVQVRADDKDNQNRRGGAVRQQIQQQIQQQQRQRKPVIQQPQQSPPPQQPRSQPRMENRPNPGGNFGGNFGGNRDVNNNRNLGAGGDRGGGILNRNNNQTTRKLEIPQNNQNSPNARQNPPGRQNKLPDRTNRVLPDRNFGDKLGGRNNPLPNNGNPNAGNQPAMKPRGNDNRPGPGIINRDGGRGPNLGDRSVLKPNMNNNNSGNNNANNSNRPGTGIINRNPGDRVPNLSDRKLRDNDNRPEILNPQGGNIGANNPIRNRLPDRNKDLKDNLKKLPPVANNRRQDNERGLIRNRDQAIQLLDKNPKLRDRVQGADGKVDLSRLHLAGDRKDRISTIVNKNGDLKLDRDLADRLRQRDRVKNLDDLGDRLKTFRDPDFINQHPELSRLDFRHASGNFQHQLKDRRFDKLVDSKLGQKLNLQQQFNLHQRGDIARQLNLNVALINHGGWKNRYMGPVFGGYTTNAFSSWYCGPGWYPNYCWTPMWCPWVDWCWWNTCPIIYDPRPIYCRPIYYYDPCPTWIVYDYPVWQPLPVVSCGTWVDLPTPVLVDNMDVRLVAVRFVDSGHSDQDLGTRYRVWFENDSKLPITTPFNVLLMASNTPDAVADLPQAGVTINSMEPGEMQVVDIRLPYAANRMNPVDGRTTPFNFLQVLVDSHRELGDVQPDNNGAVLARTDILPVDPAAFAPDVAAAAPGAIVSIAGEGFGPEPGQLIVSVNGEETEATVFGWYDLGVQFELPNFPVNVATDAEVLVIRGDGAASNPVTVRIAPENKLEQAVLPEAPLP